jgi:predicted HTH transcriptional regulator
MDRAKSVYAKALSNRIIAAYILLPLMEFEFSIRGEESPMLLQSEVNYEQLRKVFEICKKWGWTTTSQLKKKGKNFYFRLNKKGIKEIFQTAGPFADQKKNEWIKLILEKMGKKGGYRRGTKKTEEKILQTLTRERILDTETLCLKLRILPGTIREGLRNLLKDGKIEKIKEGKKFYWKIK